MASARRTTGCAAQRTVDPASLEGEPFVLFSRRMGILAYDRTIRCCLDAGFQPRIVQEAPQFPTLIRLVAAGLGVSLVPACVATIAFPGAVFRPIRSKRWTSVDIGARIVGDRPSDKRHRGGFCRNRTGALQHDSERAR